MKTMIASSIFTICMMVCGFSQEISPVGTWTVSTDNGMAKISFLEDGTYEVDANNDGTIEVYGKYSLEGNQMTVQDTEVSEGNSCSADDKGVYKITMEDGKMISEKVSDDCADRHPDEPLTWTKA